MWQLTILSILKSISVRRFFIRSSFSCCHVCDVCISFSCWIVFQFCPYTWVVVLWGALVASHGSFGWHVVSWSLIEFSLSWNMKEVCLRFESLQTTISSFGLSNSFLKRWKSMSSVNLARSFYSLLTPYWIIGFFSLFSCHLRWSEWP